MTLPDAISEALPPDDRMRIGIVTSASPVLVNVQGTEMPGNAIGSYAPQVGDNVATIRQDQTWLVLGKTSSSATGSTGPVFQAGVVTMTAAAVQTVTKAVTFARPFTRIPAVATNIHGSPAATGGWISRAITITLTGFTMYIAGAVNSFTIDVQWQATEYTQ